MARRVTALSLFPLLTLFHLLSCTETSGEAPSTPQEEPQGGPPYATLVLEATYPKGFSYLSGIRELSDGTGMVADPLAQLLLRLDMDAGTSDSLGRVGGGPGEFRQPDQVFPLPGDSTLMVDLGKATLTVVGPHGAFYEGTSMVRPSPDGRMNILTPHFVDAAGMIYHEVSRPRQGGAPDSVAAVRFDRATATSDTVASIWVPEQPARRMGSRSRVLASLLEPRDEWAVGRDGAVAVVRANGYRVDVFDGEGIRLGYVEVPLGCRLLGFGAGTDREKTAYLVRTDEVGLKWLERYRVVSSPGPDHSVDF